MKNGKTAAAIGGVTAVTAAVALTAGTYAAFSDSETGGVQTTAGTMNLVVDGPPKETGVYRYGNVVPGQRLGTEMITLTNSGSVDGVLRLELESVSNEEGQLTEPEREDGDTTADEGELLENLRISVFGRTYTLNEGSAGTTISIPQRFPAGEQVTYRMSVSVPEETDDVIQSDSAGFRVRASLEQAPNQR